MNDTPDKSNQKKLGGGKKKKTSKGKKIETVVRDTSESAESTPCTSEGVVTALPKNSERSVDDKLAELKSACSNDNYINPRELEVKCSIAGLSESANTDNASNFESIETESCQKSGSQKEVKNPKKQLKEPRSSSNSKASEKKLLKRLEINQYTNFMKDFDPDKSQREARKLENLPFTTEKKEKKKPQNDNRLYDENGIFIETGEDLCDCLMDDCPGCHFPCHKCRSLKCGHMCRRNRTWCYDEIEIEGTGIIIKRKK